MLHTEHSGSPRFGKRAKDIKNKPRINQELGVQEYKALLAEAMAKVKSLEHQLAQANRAANPGAVGNFQSKKQTTDQEKEDEEEQKLQEEQEKMKKMVESTDLMKRYFRELCEQVTQNPHA